MGHYVGAISLHHAPLSRPRGAILAPGTPRTTLTLTGRSSLLAGTKLTPLARLPDHVPSLMEPVALPELPKKREIA